MMHSWKVPVATVTQYAMLAALSLAVGACKHGEDGGHRGGAGAQHPMPDAAIVETPPRELHRAVCGAIAPASIATGVARESINFSLNDSHVRNDRGTMRAAAGWTCILESTTLRGNDPMPREGIESRGSVVTFENEQRRIVAPHAGNTSYLLSIVDDAWTATVRREADALQSEQGAALASHCARLGAMMPPDPAAMRARVEARVAHFLETGNPDVGDDAGVNALGAEAVLENIATRCGFSGLRR